MKSVHSVVHGECNQEEGSFFYIRGSVHRDSILKLHLTNATFARSKNALPDDGDYAETCWSCINKIQQDATVFRYLLTAKSLYIFRVSNASIIRST